MNDDIRKLGLVSAAVLTFTLVQACGGSSASSSSSDARGGTGGNAGTALDVGGASEHAVGGASEHANSGGTGNASGGALGSGGHAGMLTQGGSGGSGVASACTSVTADLSGSWDSAPWHESYALSSSFQAYSGANGALWQFHSVLDKDGYVLLRGQGANPKGDAMTHPMTVMFEAPSRGPTPGGWYCSQSGSTLTDSPVETRVTLANLGRLGACSDGVAVSGQISVCADKTFPADCNFTRSGTLDGASITPANLDTNQGTLLDAVDLVFRDGMVISYFRANEFDPTGPDTNGIVILPDGTLYCAGAASVHADSNGRTIDTLTDFKRLGTCANIAGTNTAQGCLGAPYKADD